MSTVIEDNGMVSLGVERKKKKKTVSLGFYI